MVTAPGFAERSVCGLFDCRACGLAAKGCKGCIATNSRRRRRPEYRCLIYDCVKQQSVDSCLLCQAEDCLWERGVVKACPLRLRFEGPTADSTAEEVTRSLRLRGEARPGAERPLPEHTALRIVTYLTILQDYARRGVDTISSYDLARATRNQSALVRKDLSLLGHVGRPSRGYRVQDLADSICQLLRLDRPQRIVWLGIGPLLSNPAAIQHFRACGGEIVGVFDSLTKLHGVAAGGQVVRPMREVSTAAARLAPTAVFVFLNDPAVQEALNQLTAAGARLVLNCTPLPLRVPGNVSLRDVDLCSHLLLGMSRALETPRQRRRRVRSKS